MFDTFFPFFFIVCNKNKYSIHYNHYHSNQSHQRRFFVKKKCAQYIALHDLVIINQRASGGLHQQHPAIQANLIQKIEKSDQNHQENIQGLNSILSFIKHHNGVHEQVDNGEILRHFQHRMLTFECS